MTNNNPLFDARSCGERFLVSTNAAKMILLPGGKSLDLARPLVMGIVNVTPDSFSGDGLPADVEGAIAQGERMVREGASLLDIGGESTRPNAAPVPAAEELRRILPVIDVLRMRVAVPLSVDTMKADVAAAAVAAGASIINDVWGFQRDPDMARVAARTGATVVLMHNRGHDGVDAAIDIMADILRFLRRSIAIAIEAGVDRRRILVDPGFGFGKTPAQNFQIVRDLGRLRQLDVPILLGVSRKSSIGRLTGTAVAADRVGGSVAAALCGVQAGADIVRVHDVDAHVQALKVLEAVSSLL